MKTQAHTSKRKVDISREMLAVFSTILALKEKYGISYLLQILQGKDTFGFKAPAHALLRTFGMFAMEPTDKLRCLVIYLFQQGYLYVSDDRFGSLALTAKAKEFLLHPEEIWVGKCILSLNTFDKLLLTQLRQLRRELAKETKSPPYHIFTDFTLHHFILEKPQTPGDLGNIPGMNSFKINRFGPAILNLIIQNQARKVEQARYELLRKVSLPAHQEVKAMFEAGQDVETMAQKRLVKPARIRRILINLYQAGEINLRPWIEEELDPKILKVGAAYFEKQDNPRLKTAYETLGLDYETLRLCKLYVANVTVSREEIRIAS